MGKTFLLSRDGKSAKCNRSDPLDPLSVSLYTHADHIRSTFIANAGYASA